MPFDQTDIYRMVVSERWIGNDEPHFTTNVYGPYANRNAARDYGAKWRHHGASVDKRLQRLEFDCTREGLGPVPTWITIKREYIDVPGV